MKVASLGLAYRASCLMYQAFVCTSQPLQQNLEVVEQCIQRNSAEVKNILQVVAAVASVKQEILRCLTHCHTPTFDAALIQGKAAAATSCAGGLGIYYLPFVTWHFCKSRVVVEV